MIKNKLQSEVVIALKNHQSRRVEILRFLISVIDKKALQLPPNSMKEEDEVAVLRKELKNKEEARGMFEKAGRADLVAEVDEEIVVTKTYLPVEMTEEAVAKVVDEVIASGANNFGQVMGGVMKRVAGNASGDMVSRLVKEKLNG